MFTLLESVVIIGQEGAEDVLRQLDQLEQSASQLDNITLDVDAQFTDFETPEFDAPAPFDPELDTSSIDSYVSATERQIRSLQGVSKETEAYVSVASVLKDQLDSGAIDFLEYNEQLERVQTAFEQLTQAQRTNTEAQQANAQAAANAASLQQATASVDSFVDSVDRQLSITSELDQTTQTYNRLLDDLSERYESGSITSSEFAEQAGRLKDSLDEFETARAKQELDELSSSVSAVDFDSAEQKTNKYLQSLSNTDPILQLDAALNSIQTEIRELETLADDPAVGAQYGEALERRLEELRRDAQAAQNALKGGGVSEAASALGGLRTRAAGAGRQLKRLSGGGADDFLFQLAFAAQDAQYGLRGVGNNIPVLVQGFSRLKQGGGVLPQLGSSLARLVGLGVPAGVLGTSLAAIAGVIATPIAVAFLDDPQEAMENLGDAGDTFLQSLGSLAKGLDLINEDGTAFYNRVGEGASILLEDFSIGFARLAEFAGADIQFSTGNKYIEALRKQTEELNRTAEAIPGYRDELQRLTEELREAETAGNEFRVESITQQLKDLDDAIENNRIAKLRNDLDKLRTPNLAEFRQELETLAGVQVDATRIAELNDELQRLYNQIDEEEEIGLLPSKAVSRRAQEIRDELFDLQSEFDQEELSLLFAANIDGAQSLRELAEFERVIVDVGYELNDSDLAALQARRQELTEDTVLFQIGSELDEVQREIDALQDPELSLLDDEELDRFLKFEERFRRVEEEINEQFRERGDFSAEAQAARDREIAQARTQIDLLRQANAERDQEREQRRADIAEAEEFQRRAEDLAESVRSPFEELLDNINEIQDVFENTDLDISVRDDAIDDLLDKFEKAQLKQSELQALSTDTIDATSLQAGELRNEIQNSFEIEANQSQVVGAIDRMREEISRQLRDDRQDVKVKVKSPKVFDLPLN